METFTLQLLNNTNVRYVPDIEVFKYNIFEDLLELINLDNILHMKSIENSIIYIETENFYINLKICENICIEYIILSLDIEIIKCENQQSLNTLIENFKVRIGKRTNVVNGHILLDIAEDELSYM